MRLNGVRLDYRSTSEAHKSDQNDRRVTATIKRTNVSVNELNTVIMTSATVQTVIGTLNRSINRSIVWFVQQNVSENCFILFLIRTL